MWDFTELAVRVPVSTVWAYPPTVEYGDLPLALLSDVYRREMVETQVLLGEPVRVVDERQGWSRIIAPWQPSRKHPDGYPGWVRSTHIAAGLPPTSRCAVITDVRAVFGDCEGDVIAGHGWWGTILPVVDADANAVVVALPGHAKAMLDPRACTVRDTESRATTFDAFRFVATAHTMLNVPHVLGGVTQTGLDCSALIHLACRILGLKVPRDARDIADSGRGIPVAGAAAGDLYFFREPDMPIHHIGIAVNTPGSMLHTPGQGVTTIEPLDNRRTTLVDVATRLAG